MDDDYYTTQEETALERRSDMISETFFEITPLRKETKGTRLFGILKKCCTSLNGFVNMAGGATTDMCVGNSAEMRLEKKPCHFTVSNSPSERAPSKNLAQEDIYEYTTVGSEAMLFL
jgi:hypothetical protein